MKGDVKLFELQSGFVIEILNVSFKDYINYSLTYRYLK